MAQPQPAPPPPEDRDDAAFVAAVQEGLRSAEEGQTLPYEEVRRWLLSWGTPEERPSPFAPGPAPKPGVVTRD